MGKIGIHRRRRTPRRPEVLGGALASTANGIARRRSAGSPRWIYADRPGHLHRRWCEDRPAGCRGRTASSGQDRMHPGRPDRTQKRRDGSCPSHDAAEMKVRWTGERTAREEDEGFFAASRRRKEAASAAPEQVQRGSRCGRGCLCDAAKTDLAEGDDWRGWHSR